MCRIAAHIGSPRFLADLVVTPTHSLLEQSQHAEEAKLAVNGDGFGVAWYRSGDPTPGTFRDVQPAWSDQNFQSLCRMVQAPLFIAHVRASTSATTSRENCHPFTFGNWSFCHNGQVPHIDRIRRRLEAALPDDLYHARCGTTDSELIFLTLLKNGLDQDVDRAWRLTVADFQPETGEKPVRMTCVFSDGKTLFGTRHASDKRCPTLYSTNDEQGHTFASEPLSGNMTNWTALPTMGVTRAALELAPA